MSLGKPHTTLISRICCELDGIVDEPNSDADGVGDIGSLADGITCAFRLIRLLYSWLPVLAAREPAIEATSDREW